MRIIRSKELEKIHVFNQEHVLKYGIEKACIIGNVEKYLSTPREQLHTKFPYIEKKKFEKLLAEIIKEGVFLEVCDE